jgi:hypothetical protein
VTEAVDVFAVASVTVREAVNVPAAAYVWVGLALDDVDPSPNVQANV